MTDAVTRIDFLRHGATEAGEALLGRTDAALTAAGRAAVARQVAGRRFAAILASPLGRARETAAVAAGSGEVAVEVEIDPDWREIDFGDWDGRARRDLAADARVAAFYRDPEQSPPPNGESMAAVRARLTAAMTRLAARAPGPVLIVTHAGAIRMALAILLAIPLPRLWALRVGCATRISVDMGADPAHGLWGEIIEIVQPPDGEGT